MYRAAILDLFSRFVVGWAVSAVNDRHLTLKALGMALKRRCPDAGLLHHSDQGCTYASGDSQRMLDANGITCSMSRRGNCHDNAVMEAFVSSVKSETADRFASCGDLRQVRNEERTRNRRANQSRMTVCDTGTGGVSNPPGRRRDGTGRRIGGCSRPRSISDAA